MSIIDKLPSTPAGTRWSTSIQEQLGRPVLSLRLSRDPKVSDWHMDFHLISDAPDARYIDLSGPNIEAEIISAADSALRGYEANKRSRLERRKRIDEYSEKFSEFLVR